MKGRLIGKDPDTGKDWGQEEKGATEDETCIQKNEGVYLTENENKERNKHEFKSELEISNNKHKFDCSNTSHSHSIICVLIREPRIVVPVGAMIILPLCCYEWSQEQYFLEM